MSVSVSLRTVFVTVVLSVVPAVVLLLLPRNKATSNKMNIAAPITQTHGEVYHSVVCCVVTLVVVDVELLDPAES